MYTTSKKKKATIYLWDGETIGAHIMRTVRDVAQDDIGSVVETLRLYSERLAKENNKTQEDEAHE